MERNDYLLSRLVNYNDTAEGSVLPPTQRGEFRVPFVQGLRILKTQALIGQTMFTLSWQEPREYANLAIDHYNIYYTFAFDDNQQPVGPYSTKGSPSTVTVPTDAATRVVFYVQTVLANGMVSELGRCPTVAGNAFDPTLDASTLGISADSLGITGINIAGLTTTNNSPGAGQITWTACTVYKDGTFYTISPSNTANKYVWWNTGDLTFSTGSSYTPQAGRYLVLTNTSGTADTAWDKVAATGITTGHYADLSITSAKVNDLSASKLTAGTIDASVITVSNLNASNITSGTLTTSRLNISPIIVAGLTLTNNSPGAGQVAWSACTLYKDGTAYSISSGNTSSKYIWWPAGASSFSTGAAFTPAVGQYLIVTNTSGTADTAWDKVGVNALVNSHYSDNSITSTKVNDLSADKLTAGTIDASVITVTNIDADNINAGTLTTSRLSLAQVMVTGMTLTNNSPGAGSVAWSACTVYRDGSAYSISSGNTSNQFIWWNSGSTSFSSGATFTPQSGRYLIATNVSGTSDTAWDKLATTAVQESNLAFSLLVGFQPETATLTDLSQSSHSSFTYTTNLINYTGGAALIAIGVMRSDDTATGSGSYGKVDIEIKIDGSTSQVITFIDGPGGNQTLFNVSTLTISQNSSGNGSTNNDYVSVPINLGARSSLEVNAISRPGTLVVEQTNLKYNVTATWAKKTS